jgi:hypothetical protein
LTRSAPMQCMHSQGSRLSGSYISSCSCLRKWAFADSPRDSFLISLVVPAIVTLLAIHWINDSDLWFVLFQLQKSGLSLHI